MRRCRCCGAELPADRLLLCEDCQAAGMGEKVRARYGIRPEEVLSVIQARQDEKRYNLLEGLTLEDITAAASLYRRPYNSYGGFRGWVDQLHRLPPEEYRVTKDRGRMEYMGKDPRLIPIARARAGLTREALGDMIYYSPASIGKWESGRGPARWDLLEEAMPELKNWDGMTCEQICVCPECCLGGNRCFYLRRNAGERERAIRHHDL